MHLVLHHWTYIVQLHAYKADLDPATKGLIFAVTAQNPRQVRTQHYHHHHRQP